MPHQVSVFAENKPGKIDRITGILMNRKINIRAITISDSGDYGIIKLILDRPEEGCEALKEHGIAATLKDIVAVRIDDTPGGLNRAAHILTESGVNVEDACGFTIRESNQAVFIFQVEDVAGTEKLLAGHGFSLLSDNELYLL